MSQTSGHQSHDVEQNVATNATNASVTLPAVNVSAGPDPSATMLHSPTLTTTAGAAHPVTSLDDYASLSLTSTADAAGLHRSGTSGAAHIAAWPDTTASTRASNASMSSSSSSADATNTVELTAAAVVNEEAFLAHEVREWAQLRAEKTQLRAENDQLRAHKAERAKLLAEEAQLLAEKERLRDENAQLRAQETERAQLLAKLAALEAERDRYRALAKKHNYDIDAEVARRMALANEVEEHGAKVDI